VYSGSILFVVAIFHLLAIHAEFVTPDEARSKALDFLKHRNTSVKATRMPSLNLVMTDEQKNGGLPSYYIFNYADSTGFVIVSAESSTVSILAYSNEGYFHVEDVDKGACVFLQQYQKDIRKARTAPLTAKQREYVQRHSTLTAVKEVLLETACLNQYDGYWYEKFSPLADAPSGCVATAAAIIMKYHGWPHVGKGKHSYTSYTNKLTLSRDFSQDTYDWDCVPMNSYWDGDWSEKAKNEVPKILLACGIACDMDYTVDGSGAGLYTMVNAMVNYFSYSTGYHYFHEDDITNGFKQSRQSIDQGRPVLVSASGDRGGHAFVMDGYNSYYYHYNLGWGGYNNGWWTNGSISEDNYKINDLFTDIRPQSGEIIVKETYDSGVSCVLDDSGLLTFSGTGSIPDEFSFNFNHQYNDVVIKEGVTGIGRYAFYYSSLTSIKIPSTLTEWGLSALFGCGNLETIEVAESNPIFVSPNNECLYNKQTKTLVVYTMNAPSITFPEGIENLARGCFYGMRNVKCIEVPEGVTTIDWYAFHYAKGLKEVILPSTLTSLGVASFAYSNVRKLTCKAMYPPQLGDNAFGNTGHSESGILYVPFAALERYREAEQWKEWSLIVAISGSEKWKDNTVANVELATAGTLSKQLPADMSPVRELKVSGPINGDDIIIMRKLSDKDNGTLSSIDLSGARIVVGGDYYYDNYDKVVENDVVPNDMFRNCRLSKLVLPETAVAIGNQILPYDLKKITIPNSVKEIRDYAFFNRNLVELYIPAGVENIGYCICSASWYLKKLEVDPANKYYKTIDNVLYTADGKRVMNSIDARVDQLSVPEGVETIDIYAYYAYYNTKILLPSTLKEIGYLSFNGSNTESITCLATTPPVMEEGFSYIDKSSTTVYVPNQCVAVYRKAEGWKDFNIVGFDATPVESVALTSHPTPSSSIYNLQGERMDATRPLPRGIYIRDGKKVFVR